MLTPSPHLSHITHHIVDEFILPEVGGCVLYHDVSPVNHPPRGFSAYEMTLTVCNLLSLQLLVVLCLGRHKIMSTAFQSVGRLQFALQSNALSRIRGIRQQPQGTNIVIHAVGSSYYSSTFTISQHDQIKPKIVDVLICITETFPHHLLIF